MKLPLEKIIRYESEDGIHVKAMDMGELMRCKDCNNWEILLYDHKAGCYCPCVDRYTVGDWFCADGERKDDVQSI